MNTVKYADVKKYLPPIDGQRFKIEHFELSKERVEREKMQAMFSGSYGEVYSLKPGKYIKLIDKEYHDIVMSDTPMELDTNREFVENAKGRILIGGLGLGLILLTVMKKPEVKEIVVVEKYQEVIDLVGKNLPLNKKVKLLLGDIMEYPIEKGFDTIYFDIWNNICADNWDDMKVLRRKWCRSLNEGGWIGSWRQDHCQRLSKEDRQYDRLNRGFRDPFNPLM